MIILGIKKNYKQESRKGQVKEFGGTWAAFSSYKLLEDLECPERDEADEGSLANLWWFALGLNVHKACYSQLCTQKLAPSRRGLEVTAESQPVESLGRPQWAPPDTAMRASGWGPEGKRMAAAPSHCQQRMGVSGETLTFRLMSQLWAVMEGPRWGKEVLGLTWNPDHLRQFLKRGTLK